MLIYIIMFFMVYIFSRRMEKYQESHISLFYALLILFLLSFVAGIRSVALGWDASKYVVSTFYRLSHFQWFQLFMNKTTVEFGFSLFSYLLYQLIPNMHFLMFGYSFLTTLFILIFAFRERKNLSMSKLMVIYYLTLYLISYNIIRQSISVAIALVSFSYFKDKKMKQALFFCILACLFHDSGIFVIPLYFIYILLNSNEDFKDKKFKCISILGIVLMIGFTYDKIATIFYHLGVLPYKYYAYVVSYNRPDYNLSNIVLNLFWFLFAFILFKVKSNYKKKNDLVFETLVLGIALLINIISIKLHPIYRIGFYYYYIGLFYFFPKIDSFFKKNSSNDKLKTILLIGILGLWFLWITVLGNGHNIYPYYSDVFTWLH